LHQSGGGSVDRLEPARRIVGSRSLGVGHEPNLSRACRAFDQHGPEGFVGCHG
jgi:hypothetical protein